MRFLVILCLLLSGSEATLAAAAATGFSEPIVSGECLKKEFPNYFEKLDPDQVKRLINESLGSILDRLEVPYEEGGVIRYGDFFKKIQDIVKDKAPGAKAYISGGMVRSLLGYVYKKLHGIMSDANAQTSFTPNAKKVIEEVLYDIVHGKRRTDALLSEFEEDRTLEEDRKSPVRLGVKTKFKPKELTPLQALGIASDYDVLIEFPEGFTGDKNRVLNTVKTFINSAQKHFGLEGDQSELKRAMVPDADVNEYSKQMDEAVKQGGATLDWLAFSLFDGMLKLPATHPEIIDDFIRGYLRYIANPKATDKQTMRGLRILLEIPFLVLDPESAKVMAAELRALITKGSLSSGALEQVKKMTRNARFGGAGNRFSGGKCMPDGEVTVLVQQLAEKLGRGTLVPKFAERRSVKPPSISAVERAPTFMSYEKFTSSYTNNDVLYHGTPDVMNFLSMIRNGLVVSSATQGVAVFGYGVYTTKDHKEAGTYAKDTGIVIPLTIYDSAHIVDMTIPVDGTIPAHREHYINWLAEKGISEFVNPSDGQLRFGAHFKEYADEFGIDIIVNEYPLIQNAKAIRFEKSLKSLIEADRAIVRAKVKAGTGVTFEKIIRAFSSTEGYGKIFPPSEEDKMIFKNLTQGIEVNDFFVGGGMGRDISFILVLPLIKKLIDENIMNNLGNARELQYIPDDLLASVKNILLLKPLIETGVMSKLSAPDLKYVPADLSEEKVKKVLPILQKSVELESAYYLKNVFALSSENLLALERIFTEGLLKNKLKAKNLENIQANLSEDKVDALIHLFKEGVIDKPINESELAEALTHLSAEHARALIFLFEKGVFDKVTISHLRFMPPDLSDLVRNFDTLKELVEIGIMNKLSTYDLSQIPQDLSFVSGKMVVLKRLIVDEKVMDKLTGANLQYVSNLSEESADVLEQLLEVDILDKITEHNLSRVPKDLSFVSGKMGMLKRLIIDEKVMDKLTGFSLPDVSILSEENTEALIQLVKAKLTDRLRSLNLRDARELTLKDATIVIELYKAGCINRLESLRNVHLCLSDLSEDQILKLKQLGEAGIIESLDLENLFYVPADLSVAVDQIEILKEKVRKEERKLSLEELANLKQ